MNPYDKQLSLAIDTVHDQLDRLTYRKGIRTWVVRWWLKCKLQWLEAQIPE